MRRPADCTPRSSRPRSGAVHTTRVPVRGVAVMLSLIWLSPLWTSAAGQPASGPVYEAYQRAHALVERALDAHGGAAPIRTLRGIDYRYAGVTYDRDQTVRASDAFDSLPPSRPVGFRIALDIPGGRTLSESDVQPAGEAGLRSRTVQRGREVLRFALPLPDRRGDGLGSSPRRTVYTVDSVSAPAATGLPFQQQLMPVLVLRQAIVRANTLRYLGRRAHARGADDVVTMNNADGSVLALGFDTRTGLLSTVETVGEIGLFGDGDHVWRFRDYRAIDGLLLAGAFQHRINGLLQEDLRLVAAQLNPSWSDTTFAAPAGYVAQAAVRSAPPPARVVRVGPSSYVLEGASGYRVLVAEHDSGLVVVEAPLNARTATEALGLLREASPGKSVTHVVLTHHHLDHVGGIRPFVEAGAVVVAPSGAVEYLRRIIGASLSFGTLGQPRRPPVTPRIEAVAPGEQRRIGPLRLLHVATSHAAGMLVAHLPSERLLFQADLLQVDEPGGAARPAATAAELETFVRRSTPDVDRIVGVHGHAADAARLSEAAREWERRRSRQ